VLFTDVKFRAAVSVKAVVALSSVVPVLVPFEIQNSGQ
jgi:hypothetical protein